MQTHAHCSGCGKRECCAIAGDLIRVSDLEIHGMEKGDSILWMEKIKKCGFTLDVSGANFAPTWKRRHEAVVRCDHWI
ncbi:hypothetical protein [Ralstonia pseudosolanacearum]|uniref:hypothetical protein n=1 Tax=Ralstonia pseudosolanacearum TaxID=1310165 RepID=UPI0012DA8B0E|nr:hypothetical protein [Ralstonia pseudosolanacearum]